MTFVPRAAHLARASLNRSDRGKRPSYWNGSLAAAAAASGAGVVVLLTSYDTNVQTHPSRAIQLSSFTEVFDSETKFRNFYPKHHRFNASVCPVHTVRCDANENDGDSTDGDSTDEDGEDEQLLPLYDNDSGYTEAERFSQCLEYHRSLLFDYHRRWGQADTLDETKNEQGDNPSKKKTSGTNHNSWPRRIPTDSEITALENDLTFCLRDPNLKENSESCHNLQFRIAAYYLAQDDPFAQRTGFKKIKLLAEQGHPDAMCYYGEYKW